MNTHFSLYIFDKIWYNFPINFGGISMDEILNNTEDFFDDEFEGKYISNVDIPENSNLFGL